MKPPDALSERKGVRRRKKKGKFGSVSNHGYSGLQPVFSTSRNQLYTEPAPKRLGAAFLPRVCLSAQGEKKGITAAATPGVPYK